MKINTMVFLIWTSLIGISLAQTMGSVSSTGNGATVESGSSSTENNGYNAGNNNENNDEKNNQNNETAVTGEVNSTSNSAL